MIIEVYIYHVEIKWMSKQKLKTKYAVYMLTFFLATKTIFFLL